MSIKRYLNVLMPSKLKDKVRERLVSISVTHLYGPKSIRLSGNEAVVTCAVRNGEYYIESFIRHYSQMGFRHIFFLDNGSSDQTISIAKRHKNVSICRSTLPIEGNQELFKKYLAQNAAEGGWRLDADIDEFFDYPFSEVIRLDSFIEYLNKNQFNAVITQLLDMFSDKPLAQLAEEKDEDPRVAYQYFDISEIRKTAYHASEITATYGHRNTFSNRNAELYWGGLRKTLCGNDCLLTKHSLFLPGKRLELFPHVHFMNNAKLADVSCAMLHYKFTRNALAIALQNKREFPGNSKIYDGFIDFIQNKSSYQIKQNTATKFRSVSDLVENGFLFASEGYCEYVRNLASGESRSKLHD